MWLKLLSLLGTVSCRYPWRNCLAIFMFCLLSLALTNLISYVRVKFSWQHSSTFGLKPYSVDLMSYCKTRNRTVVAYCSENWPYPVNYTFNYTLLPYVHMLNILTKRQPINPYAFGELKQKTAYVTAVSFSKFALVKQLIKSFAKVWKGKYLTVYDLGLTSNQLHKLENTEFIKVKQFNFDAYPSYVRRLPEYRWKPLIIANELRSNDVIWWMDTSIQWKKKYRDNRYREYLLFDGTEHSIYAATNPSMYDFLNTNQTAARSTEMYGANLQMIRNTAAVWNNMIKYWVLCALEPNCMAPTGSNIICQFFGGERFNYYANCHRYDQSALNILLANYYNYDTQAYTDKLHGFAAVQREILYDDDNRQE